MNNSGDGERETFLDPDEDTAERISTFLEACGKGNTPFLAALEEEALEEGIPIIRTQTQSVLRFLLALKKPERILEVGTATGFSSLFMLEQARGACLVSMEKDPERWQKAVENRDRAVLAGVLDKRERAEYLLGDAEDLLKKQNESFDFIFMDAAKGQYIHFLPEVKRLLAPGGVLVSDNIFKDGEVLDSRYAVVRRDRTIHRRMREYIRALRDEDSFETMILQEGDGMAVSVKRES